MNSMLDQQNPEHWLNAPLQGPGHASAMAPTLTEVVETYIPEPAPLVAQRLESAGSGVVTDLHAGTSALVATEDQLVKRVMLDLQQHIDLMLEYRLREALMPVLARATDALVLEARNELASTLLAVVELAVAKSVAKALSESAGIVHGQRVER